MRKVEHSIILPCYNEGSTLEKSIKKIIKVLVSLNKSWEIILIEDKSTDETKKVVEKNERKSKNVQAIYHTKNEGRGKSVTDGIRKANSEVCGYLDVDLEVSSSYIPLFIEEIEKGNDMVIGKRFYERGLKSLSRFLASKVYSGIVKFLLHVPIDDTEAGYKFFKRSKILPILKKTKSNHWFWDTEICAQAYWSGLKISQIPVLFIRRSDKKSTVKLFPDTIAYITNLIRLRLHSKKYGKNSN